MQDHISASSLYIHGGIAFFGAIVHASKAYRSGTTKSLLDFVVLTIMASFSGVMFALMGLHFFSEQTYMSMAMAGTGGFLGVEGMAFVVERIRGVLQSK